MSINAVCKDQNSKDKHVHWGYNRKTKAFATSEETLEAIQPVSIQSLQKMRAGVGIQSKASRIPALVPTSKLRFRISGNDTVLPSIKLFRGAPGFSLFFRLSVKSQGRKKDGACKQEIFALDGLDDKSGCLVRAWGVPWGPGLAAADPYDRSVKCFKMRALPSETVMSVHSCLQVGHSLWAILMSIFGVFVSNYFDDFVAFAAEAEVESVTSAVTMMFKTLGWIFAGKKAPPFGDALTALGPSPWSCGGCLPTSSWPSDS